MSTQMPRVERGTALHDSEIAKRAAPGGRVPVGGLKASDHRGGSSWTSVADGSPSAVAGQQERDFRRDRPDLVAKRAGKGK